MDHLDLFVAEDSCRIDMDAENRELEVLDNEGVPLGESKSPEVCHKEGFWHRSVTILVFTEWGEVILEKRVGDEALEPDRWAIPEEHVSTRTSAEQCVLDGLTKRFGFNPESPRLRPLTSKNAIVEESQFAASDFTNRERKTLYTYTLSWDEYNTVQDMKARLADQSSGETADGDPAECLAGVRLISAKEILEEIETKPAEYSSGTLAVLRESLANKAIFQFWSDLVREKRQAVLKAVTNAVEQPQQHRLDDSVIMEAINPSPKLPAAEFEVMKVFFEGKDACPGAYHIGEMIETAGHIRAWAEKLSDPYQRYVEEDIDSLKRGTHDVERIKQIKAIDKEVACRFVRDVLHFPLENGMLLRNQMGNLEEISASRNAFKLYLRSHTTIPVELITNPQKEFNEACNRLVRDTLKAKDSHFDALDDWAIQRLLKLNVLLNALDFHSPDFHGIWAQEEAIRALIEKQFETAEKAEFASSLGADVFVEEFLRTWLSPERDRPVRLAYFLDNNGQLVVSLKCIEVFLRRKPDLTIILVPKNGQHGNDASWDDVYGLLEIDAKNSQPVFDALRQFVDAKRLVICRQGPQAQGLNPRHLSQELCYHLNEADVILTEGQAYAEIRGWFKPTYMLFQVKGRVAEAVHGVSKNEKALALVRVGGGVYHFSGLKRLPERSLPISGQADKAVHIWGQTTSDYVRAILSDNYRLLRDRVFNGKEEVLFRQLRQEAARTGKSVAQVILGTEPPTLEETQQHWEKSPIQAFAVGGGGGFNQVTLKALQMLGLNVAAGVPSTDDGGSTGKLQEMISRRYGYMFGVGDAAAILEQQVVGGAKQPILSFRPSTEAQSLTEVLIEQILREASHPTIESEHIVDCKDFLAFVCEQLNFARIIDNHFLGPEGIQGFSIKGASIRNLNILAAFHVCAAIDREAALAHPDSATNEENAERAWLLLLRAYGIADRAAGWIRTIPVTYDRACLWATYGEPISETEIERLTVPGHALSEDHKTVYGQRYIDQIIPMGKIVAFGLANRTDSEQGQLPRANRTYLRLVQSVELFIMGAGSLFGSQLAQLAVTDVVDELVKKKSARKVFILNHVCMNETMFYSLTDHIKAVERLANSVVHESTKDFCGGSINIGHLFTDIVVPRTVAREIDAAIAKDKKINPKSLPLALDHIRTSYCENPKHVTLNGNPADEMSGIFLNRYVDYVLQHQDFRKENQITDWELQVLGFLDQAPSLYKSRSEAGRYRGAVYALDDDIEYLISQGIPARHIYEVESIAMNNKILKAEGKPRLEVFPGLIPESLVGIFKILLAKGSP